MPKSLSVDDYRALASLRYLLRRFVAEGDAAAREAGLEPLQYQLMLAIRGLPKDMQPSIQTLAQRLVLKHNTTVELVDRMEEHGYVSRTRSPVDRRRALVALRPKAQRLVDKVARRRIVELRRDGTALAEAMIVVLHGKHDARKRSPILPAKKLKGKRYE